MTGEFCRRPRRAAGGCTRIGAVGAGYALALWAVSSSGAGVRAAATAPGPVRPDAVVAAAGLLLAWSVLIWWGVTFLLLLVGRLPGCAGRVATAFADRVAPAAVARLARYALGVGLATGATAGVAGAAQATVASAAPDPVPDAGPAVSLDRPVLRELQRPPAVHRHGSRNLPTPPPTPAAAPSAAPAPAPRAAPAVIVRSGDTLWAIGARHLPAGASVARVAAEWPRWYRANVDVVGPDPDLIRPGQRLRPAPTEETR